MNRQPIDAAPRDGRRILGYGTMGLESSQGFATIKWDTFRHRWICDPNEASEYDPEECQVTYWWPLPEVPT